MDLVRCLTSDGIRAFGDYLERLRQDGTLRPPTGLLTDASCSRACALGDVFVEARGFSSRRDFAEYIDRRFVAADIFVDADETGMWEWLSLYYLDAVCPRNRNGVRRPGVDGRHLLNDRDARRRHRHLLRGPYMVFRRFAGGPHGELDLLLSYPLPVHGVAATHVGERPRLMASRGALTAASWLYVDRSKGEPIPGYADERTGLRAYCKFLNNLPDCFDLSALSAETVMALLPSEFAVWMDDNRPGTGEAGQSDGAYRGGKASNRAGGIFEALRTVASLSDVQLAMGLSDLLHDLGERRLTERQALVRSDLFRTAVLGSYDSRCAISGVGLRHAEDSETGHRYEVEAAHIIPVSRGGKDLVPNGLALTRTLHWAFDQGMLWIDDEAHVRVTEEADRDRRNHWLRQFRGRPLRMPADVPQHPHREALRWHASNIARMP